jgi:hypothetical protein
MKQFEKQLEMKEWVRRELPVTSLWNFTLTGDYATDEKRVDGVRALAEKFNGEFEFNYAHKVNLYRFEIGGRFETQKDADQFAAAIKRLFTTWTKAAAAGK